MMRRKLLLIGCILLTFTSLYIYNSSSSYVVPLPPFNLYRSTNEVFPDSDRRMLPAPIIGRALAKNYRSEVGGTDVIERRELNTFSHEGNLRLRENGTMRFASNKTNNSVTDRTFYNKTNLESKSEHSNTVVSRNTTLGVFARSKLWANYGTTSNCSPSKTNVAFIKTHKTGSTTLGHLINRYGYHNRLSFVMNKHSRHNGHLVYYNVTKDSPRLKFLPPIGVKMRDYNNYKYNIIAIHVRYNRHAMDSFMKPNTKYISIIRDPGSQFESAFSHFQFDDAFPINERRKFNTTKDKLEHFLKKPNQYRDRLKLMSWENSMGLRWYYARNNQAFDLGLDHKYHMNTNMVQKFIDRLGREITVVLLTEYLNESLLVLRKKMCWTWSDILYIAKNRRPQVETLPELLREKIRSWNAVDTMMYNHFNRTLWKQVKEYGENFQEDLSMFKEMLNQVFTECVSTQYQKSQGRDFHWVEYQPRVGSSYECKLLVESKKKLFKKIWTRQDMMSMLNDRSRYNNIMASRRTQHGYYSAKRRTYKVGGYPPKENKSINMEKGKRFDANTRYRQPIHPQHTRRAQTLQAQRQSKMAQLQDQ
ncbi:uncharacterized protein [Antedon mediterranea]|uniref:uncharacterized protein isoform X2 n=1 Tax=Antedon mediterranea TaxID=105859 RepID=UPI003AF66518